MSNGNAILKEFEKYYRECKLELPPMFTHREYGFMFFDKKSMYRHIKFSTEKEVKKFLVEHIPMHAYYSTAYYKKPNETSMDGKQWLGADLVFDLDADHVPASKDLSYEEMLKVIKKETKKVIEEFLIPDFGFDEKKISVYFSGGRGYHIHIRDEKVFNLKSNERRELSAYITGSGLELDKLYIKKYNNQKIRKGSIVPKVIEFYDESYYGWSGKFTKYLKIFLKDLADSHEYAEKVFENYDFKFVKKMKKELFDGEVGSRKIDEIVKEQIPNISFFKDEETMDLFLNLAIKEVLPRIKGEIDEPVTTDIHRLIRMPGSIHGKTGLMVTPILYNEIEDFDPLSDAIAPPFLNSYMNIKALRNIEITFNQQHFKIGENEQGEFPTYLSLFLLLRNLAVIL